LTGSLGGDFFKLIVYFLRAIEQQTPKKIAFFSINYRRTIT